MWANMVRGVALANLHPQYIFLMSMGIAVTTILVLLYCGFGPGNIQYTESHDNIFLRDYLDIKYFLFQS